jgi:hypothetical protein
MSRARCAAAITLLAAATSIASADDAPPFTIGSQPRWVLLGGATAGATVAPGDRGALVGGEVSFARLRDASFVGVFGDAYYDWGAHGTYATAGIEAGHSLLGLDVGLALRFAGDGTDVGTAARLTVGIGMVGVYGRFVHFWEGSTDENVVQVGLVVKLPLWTEGN